jgi:hypothetical protein
LPSNLRFKHIFTTTNTNTNNSRERVERERDEGDDGEKSSRAPVASDHRLGEQSARRRRRHD